MPGQFSARTWRHDPAMDAPPKYRRACRYEAFIPEPLTGLKLDLPAETAGVVSEAESATRALNEAANPALAPLSRLLLRTESIASSRVEGMQADVRDFARAEARHDLGRLLGRETAEVLANLDAMELALHEAAAADGFGPPEILAIHKRLMENGRLAHLAGKFRTGQNWIGGNDYNPCGADFVPPPVEELDALLHDLCIAIVDDRLPPLVQAALVHAQFETIHPFDDGNGRTGRALIHVVLRRRNLAPSYVPPVSVVLANQRERYIEGLTRFRGTEVVEWIEQFAAATYSAARLATAYLREVRALSARWSRMLAEMPGAPRADAAAWAVIHVLPALPIITAPAAVAATARARSQVYVGIRQLEDAGVLIPLSGSRRNRSWEAIGLLDLLAGLEAGEALG